MARRPQLTAGERRLFFGIPDDPDGLARQYTFTRSDQDLVSGRRGAANQLGFAVQLALLRAARVPLAKVPVGHFKPCNRPPGARAGPTRPTSGRRGQQAGRLGGARPCPRRICTGKAAELHL
jgi:Domain of unknown function (DUF4158)